MSGEVRCGYILQKEQSWMVDQKLESGLVLMRLVMGIGSTGLINALSLLSIVLNLQMAI